MPANGTTTGTKPAGQGASSASHTSRNVTDNAVAYVRQTAERSVDVPVGAVLTVAERVNDVVEPWTKRTTAERELRSIRTQVTRELNRIERRGTSARRKATQRAKTTRNRVRRDVNQRRRSVERTLKQNRTEVSKRVRDAQATVSDRVSALV
jgi:F0F1-type ATP synthase membrane subunit b/b'